MIVGATHNKNTGIVPPWLVPTPKPVDTGNFIPLPGPDGNRNPGIVPPWLQVAPTLYDPTKPITPVDPDTPHIMYIGWADN